jgi:hypothetical protein
MTNDKVHVVTAGELMQQPQHTQKFIVDGLLRLGRRRPSLLLGKPESGKSTLAMQLAVAVTKGLPFLGRNTQRSEVLYWSSEETDVDLATALRVHGYNPETDERLFFNTNQEEPMKYLDAVLSEYPEIRLVMIETLDDFLNVQDLKENSHVRRAFEKFDASIIRKHAHRASFLALHHLKKRETDSAGDAILGATVLRGRTDAKLYLKQMSDDDPRRIFHATVRMGAGIPQTVLDFNPTTLTSTLGVKLADERKQSAVKTDEKILADITEFFIHHPKATFEKECLPALSGNSDRTRRVFRDALRKGLFKQSGTGKKGDPYVYEVAPIPIELAA